MFHIRFERVFQLGNNDGAAAGDGFQHITCCSSSGRVYDPSKPPWMQQPWAQPTPWAPQVSADSAGSGLPGLFARKKRSMTSIWIDSRKRVASTDSDFEFDIGETVHLQGSARLGVFKIRVADTATPPLAR